jgi:hypothetical protein
MAETEDHRAMASADYGGDACAHAASPFALDTERRAALSLVLMNGFALGDLARLLDCLHLRQRAGTAPCLQLGDRRHLRPLACTAPPAFRSPPTAT